MTIFSYDRQKLLLKLIEYCTYFTFICFLYSAIDIKVITDRLSFLFTLVNPSRTEPMKLPSKPGASIRCRSDLGPGFGTKDYYDLKVSKPSISSASNYLTLGNGFTCPENVDKNTFFCGKNPFEISELEVFKVNF